MKLLFSPGHPTHTKLLLHSIPGARAGVTYSQGSPYPLPHSAPAVGIAEKEGIANP